MSFATDAFGYLSGNIGHLAQQVMTPSGMINIAALIVGWFLTRAATAVFGEYAKRFWFRRVWRDEVARCKLAFEQYKDSVAAERAEHQWAMTLAERLIVENDALLLRVIQLETAAAARVTLAEKAETIL